MKNSDLFKYPTETLTEIERQKRYVLSRALQPMPCPMCFEMVSQVDASGGSIDDYDLDGIEDKNPTCPHCKTELTFILPFQGPAFWRRRNPITPPAAEPPKS